MKNKTNRNLNINPENLFFRVFEFIKNIYTLMKDHETESIVINEEYLVYATVFGIADKVQDELGKFKSLVLYNYGNDSHH